MLNKNINIGVLIINKNKDIIGYSEEKGFFMSKGSFSLESDIIKKTETIWFSNVEEDYLPNNIKKIDFFSIKLNDIFKHNGLILTPRNKEFVLKKMHDFLKGLISNAFLQFNDKELDRINSTTVNKRIKDRTVFLKESSSYKEFLMKISLNTSKNLFIKNKDELLINKSIKIRPFDIYSRIIYQDKTINKKLINKTKILTLNDNHRKVHSNKTLKIKVLTLNKKTIDSIPLVDIYRNECYNWVDLENRIKEHKNNLPKILYRSDLLFLKIKTTVKARVKNDLPMIFKQLHMKEFLVSREEYNWYCDQNWFDVKIIDGVVLRDDLLKNIKKIKLYSKEMELSKEEMDFNNFEKYKKTIESLKAVVGDKILFNSKSFKYSMEEELRINKLQNFIHSFNYLQIVLLNDNFLLNEWIKSQLTKNNLELVRYLALKDIMIESYDHLSITISININEKENARYHLEKLNLLYPSILL